MSLADLDAKLLSALFPLTVEEPKVTPEIYKCELLNAGIGCFVSAGRLKLRDGQPQERDRLYAILHGNPDLEARIILRIAMNDSDVMDMITERASIRWADGYSDSLYLAALCNITDTGEVLEYSDQEARVVKQKPRTDWEAELRRQR